MLRCAITDRGYLIGQATGWAETGVDFVQLRDKTLGREALQDLARVILGDIARHPGAQTRLLINGDADLAAAVGAAGVHLTARPDEMTPDEARTVFRGHGHEAPIVSVSCHTLAEVERARDAQVDFVLFAPVFEKRVKGEVIAPGVGLEALAEACRAAAPVPVLALGGVTTETTQACLNAGATGIAGIRLFG